MQAYAVLNKKVGETPLALTERFRKENPWIGDKKLAYAGRLDPMASGKLLVLIGDECKKQNKYLALDKEYTFEVLLGFSSDTGDVLGIATRDTNPPLITDSQLKDVTEKFTGNISMPFPAYSSKTVKGKPLFLWTLENKLAEITIPIKNSKIYKLSFRGTRTISAKEVHEKIFEKINSIPKVTETSKALGRDFRRKEIRERWNTLFAGTEDDFQVVTFSCIASSGTYMRSLAGEIGQALGTEGLAYSIHRTKIGRYKKLWKNIGIWYKKFT